MTAEAPAQHIMPVASKEDCLSVDDATLGARSLLCAGNGRYELAAGWQIGICLRRSFFQSPRRHSPHLEMCWSYLDGALYVNLRNMPVISQCGLHNMPNKLPFFLQARHFTGSWRPSWPSRSTCWLAASSA